MQRDKMEWEIELLLKLMFLKANGPNKLIYLQK